MDGKRVHRFGAACMSAAVALAVALSLGHDAAAQKKKGAAVGAGLGALIGQGIGKDTESTLIGAGIGAGVGYIIGNERDKNKAESISTKSTQPAPAAQTQAESTPAPATTTTTTAQPDVIEREDVGALKDTMWALTSMNPEPDPKDYVSKISLFRPEGVLVTLTTLANGEVLVSDETYRVVDDVLIINKPGYLINARFLIDGEQLILNAQNFSAVFTRLKTGE